MLERRVSEQVPKTWTGSVWKERMKEEGEGTGLCRGAVGAPQEGGRALKQEDKGGTPLHVGGGKWMGWVEAGEFVGVRSLT